MSLARALMMLPLLLALGCARAVPNPTETPAEKRISVNFDKFPLKSALELIARASGANIIVNSGVTGTVTVSLQDTPWRDVLAAVVGNCGMKLVFEEKHNLVRVTAP